MTFINVFDYLNFCDVFCRQIRILAKLQIRSKIQKKYTFYNG